MTTLTVMKARIASELRRSDLTSQIASAITTAIEAYQHERFGFSESRELTFDTVASQEFYTASDDADIGLIKKIDHVHVYVGDMPYEMCPETPERIELLSTNGTASGTPLSYCWFAKKFRVYPIPSEAYTIRITGTFKVAAPATDEETDNDWMLEGERLIRSRAKYEIALHVLRDMDLAQAMTTAIQEAKNQLLIDAAQHQQQGGWRISPTMF